MRCEPYASIQGCFKQHDFLRNIFNVMLVWIYYFVKPSPLKLYSVKMYLLKIHVQRNITVLNLFLKSPCLFRPLDAGIRLTSYTWTIWLKVTHRRCTSKVKNMSITNKILFIFLWACKGCKHYASDQS